MLEDMIIKTKHLLLSDKLRSNYFKKKTVTTNPTMSF